MICNSSSENSRKLSPNTTKRIAAQSGERTADCIRHAHERFRDENEGVVPFKFRTIIIILFCCWNTMPRS